MHRGASAAAGEIFNPVVNVWLPGSVAIGNCVNAEINLEHIKGKSYEVRLETNSNLAFDSACTQRNAVVAGYSHGKDEATTIIVYTCAIGDGILTATKLLVDDKNQSLAGSLPEGTTTIVPRTPTEKTKKGDWICRQWFGKGYISKWDSESSAQSDFGRVEILNAKIIRGVPLDPRGTESCVKARFTSGSNHIGAVVVDGDMHIIQKKLDKVQFDINNLEAMTLSDVAEMFVAQAPAFGDSVKEGDSAHTLSCNACNGDYTETAPKLVRYQHLRRPVVYAYGSFSFDNGGPTILSTKWLTPYKKPPSQCELNSPSPQPGSGYDMLANFVFWIVEEAFVDPYVCGVIYRYAIESELKKDIPEHAEKIAKQLIGRFISFWRVPKP